MPKSKGYVSPEYLQRAAAMLTPVKLRSYELMQLGAGKHVLDVGCGAGLDTIALGHVVGSTGSVLGIDHDPEMINEANARASQAGLSEKVRHQVGDATSLPLASDQFDACRSERLFMHLNDAPQALTQMVRVTKSGGWVVVLDLDWGTTSIDTPEVDVERRLARLRAERMLHNGYSGRQLYRMFKDHKLQCVTYEVIPVVTTDCALARYLGHLDDVERESLNSSIVSPEELQRWRDSLEHSDQNGTFFATTNMVIVVGCKP